MSTPQFRFHSNPLLLLLPLFALAACATDEPTAPATSHGSPLAAAAGQRLVTSLADPGDGTCDSRQCTLREAINDAGSTAITFAPGLTGSITLARPGAGGGTIIIGKSLAVTGPTGGITIRRRPTDPSFRILRVQAGATVTLANLTLTGGEPGIINYGSLALVNSKVLQGGTGINNYAALTLDHSAVARNTADGIFNSANGTLSLAKSSVAANGANGILNRDGRVSLTGSTVSDNEMDGIESNRGEVRLNETRILANRWAGIQGGRRIYLNHSTVARNGSAGGEGGIALPAGTLAISNSTIVGNLNGDGIHAWTSEDAPVSVTLTNSTVSGNTGNGITALGFESILASLTVTNTTVAFNRGRGIHFFGGEGGVARLTNSIVAENLAPTSPEVWGENYTSRFSLIGDGSGSDIENVDGNQVGNVLPYTSPIDPLLGPLALNGGPARTHALGAGSPALDAASAADCPMTDQRGVARPQGPGCDIGSYERE
jgi:CSLREA domain-containing protein